MSGRLSDKVCIITWTDGSIGRAAALVFAQEGASVVGCDVNVAAAEATAAMVRAQGGYVTPWGGQQLPLLDGFFGGPQLVRGFAPNGFGPRDITPGTAMDNVGGNIYWTSSAELEAPVPGVPADANLKVALFSDVGSLWATGAGASSLASLSPSQQIANSQAMRASIGTALIWNSPFGPLQVNYAYPIAKQPTDVTQRLNFSAGAF